MKRLLNIFLRWFGVSLTEETLTPHQYRELLKRMATIEDKLAQVESDLTEAKAFIAEGFTEVTEKLGSLTTQLGEQQGQIELLKKQLEDGGISTTAAATLDRILALSAQNVTDAKAIADIIPNPPIDPVPVP